MQRRTKEALMTGARIIVALVFAGVLTIACAWLASVLGAFVALVAIVGLITVGAMLVVYLTGGE